MPTRLFAVLRTLIFASLFVALWTWFAPRWMAMAKHVALQPVWGWSLIPMLIGGLIMVRCCWDFAWTGRGTPMPLDPPRRLVITGLYRRVRNPMYLGMGLFLIGEAFLLPAVTREMLIMTVVLFLAVNVFVMLYEEPVLRSTFGDDYERYKREVGRWVPRRTPYRNVSS
jgi:protein-S-isoprenylcysteine O-methyltransferase Ste14